MYSGPALVLWELHLGACLVTLSGLPCACQGPHVVGTSVGSPRSLVPPALRFSLEEDGTPHRRVVREPEDQHDLLRTTEFLFARQMMSST